MRCFGKGYEEFYQRLHDEGVHVVRGRAAEVTNVALSPEEEGRLVVQAEDTLLGNVRRIPADMVILSSGLAPAKDAKEVSQTFGFGCSANGFFLERHPKLEPVCTVTDGIFIAGCCQYPKDIPDTVAQAAQPRRARWRWSTTRSSRSNRLRDIDPEECSGCHICVRSARTPRSSSTWRRTSPRSSPTPARAAAPASPRAGSTSPGRYFDDQLLAEIEGVMAL